MGNWIDLGIVEDIPKLGARIIKTPAHCIAVFRNEDDELFALENRCPHKGGPLSEGIVHGRSVTCPLHNAVISLETGEALNEDYDAVASYQVKAENGRVLIHSAAVSANKTN